MKSLMQFSIFASLLLLLVACGGGGSGSSNVASNNMALQGGGVKGPLVDALVTVYKFDGAMENFRGVIVDTGHTDQNAQLTGISLDVAEAPFIIEYTSDSSTIDLTTNAPPVLATLRTYVSADLLNQQPAIPVYATPLTTLALDLAIINSPARLNVATFESVLITAARDVVATMGFGLSDSVDIFQAPPLINDNTQSLVSQESVVRYRSAIEMLTAISVGLKNAAMASNNASTISADDMLSALAVDLQDGQIDAAVGGNVIASFRDVENFVDVVSVDPMTQTIPDTSVLISNIDQLLAQEAMSLGRTEEAVSALLNGSVNVVPRRIELNLWESDVYSSYPRVVSAISEGNTRIIISYSRPMGVSALNPANYVVVQTDVNPEAGLLIIKPITGEFADEEHTAIRLFTESQNELTYTLSVVNVKDENNQPLDVVAARFEFISANKTNFAGTPPSGDELVDSDGDGISDNEEQRGYVVTIVQSNGEVIYRDVTSDPLDETGDTDGDGVSDLDERQFGSDPRSVDTDGDGLDDNLELNSLYSHPAMVDTDGDGLEDGLEFITLSTSPILADTDGDQLDDDVELFERFRDPRIADLPKLSIVPGDSFISLNETYSYTTEEGEVVVTETSSTAQLTSSEGRNVLTLDEKVVEDLNTGGIRGTIKGGLSEEENKTKGWFVWAQVEAYGEWSDNTITTTGTDTELFREAQKVLEDSYAKGNEISSRNEVTRTVDNAVLNVALSLRNKSDIAFTVTDVEITVLQLRPGTRKFEPIATMSPQSGDNPEYQLGPFNGEIGPLVFTAQQLPVDVAEGLMRNASGLAFQVANYTITDEFGRQFTYINQEVQDVTAGLVIDYGFSGVDRYQIAASAIKGEGANEVKGGFNAVGRSTGIALTDLLENQLGWVRNSTVLDAIVAGSNGVAESVAVGDDIQRITVGTRGLEVGAIVVDAGPNGVLDSSKEAGTDDEEVVSRGYQVSATCGTNSTVFFKAAKACSAPVECLCTEANGCPEEYGDDSGLDSNVDVWPAERPQCDGPNIITRVGAYRNLPGSYRWVALTNADTTTSADVDSILMKPGDSFKLAFVQDLDGDGLFSRVEFLQGSVDSPMNQEDNTVFGDTYRAAGPVAACVGQSIPLFCQDEAVDSIIALADSRDTDRDGMDDPVEVNEGWTVAANGQPRRQVYSSPTLRDSDGDGLTDKQERDIRFSCAQVFLLAGVNREVDVDNAGPFYLGEPVSSEYSIVGYPINYLEQASYLDEFMGLVDDPWSSDEPERRSLLPDYNDETVSPYDAVAMIAPYCVPDLDIGTDTLSRAASLDPTDSDTDGDGIPDGAELLGYKIGKAMLAQVDYEDYQGEEPIFLVQGDDVLVRAFSRTIKKGDIILLPGDDGVFDTDYVTGFGSFAVTSTIDDSQVEYVPYENIFGGPGGDDGYYESPTGYRAVHCGADGISQTSGRGNDRVVTNPGDTCSGGIVGYDGAVWKLAVKPSSADTTLLEAVKNTVSRAIGGSAEVTEYFTFLDEREEQWVRSNPLDNDTDDDLLSDGAELALSTNPIDPTDARGLNDSDNDGIFDIDEQRGFVIKLGNAGNEIDLTVYSNATNPDTDEDGLPDFVEYQIGSNPANRDTDNDGLSDYDELASVYFARYARYVDEFAGFELDSTGSMQYGTSLTMSDTDGDGISDGDEINGIAAVIRVNGIVENILLQTSATNDDSDGDDLTDQEEIGETPATGVNSNPMLADTDGDGRGDREESLLGSDPLQADGTITLTLLDLPMRLLGSEASPDWAWTVSVQAPPDSVVAYEKKQCGTGEIALNTCDDIELGAYDTYPGTLLAGHELYYGDGTYVLDAKYDVSYVISQDQYEHIIFSEDNKRELTLQLQPGDVFTLSVSVAQYDGAGSFSCNKSAVMTYSFEDIAFYGDRLEEVDLSNGSCNAQLRYQVSYD